jgi:hypothetical protein
VLTAPELDRGSKGPNDADWISTGPGLQVGSYRRTQVPPDVIDKVGGIDIIFTAPDPSILAGKTIEVNKGRLTRAKGGSLAEVLPQRHDGQNT